MSGHLNGSIWLSQVVVASVTVVVLSSTVAGSPDVAAMARALRELPATVVPEARRAELSSMVREHFRRRTREVNSRSSAAWNRIEDLAEWQRFRDARLDRLRASLGPFPAPPERLATRVTGSSRGDGFRIENTLYESRPGLWVTGTVYAPSWNEIR